jgi:hypothetical protein
MHPEDFNNIQDELVYNKSESMANLGQLAYNFVENTPERLIISSRGNVSAGLQKTNRHFRGKNYHIDNIDIQSYVSPSKKTGGAKYTNANLTISEPYGATLIENLIKATVFLGQKNYHEMPYLLKISFKGWNGDGAPQNQTLASNTTKWLMLKIGNINFKVDPDGTDYNIEMYNYSDGAFGQRHGSLPVDIQVNSNTLNDFFQFEEVGDSGGTLEQTETNTVATDNYAGQALAQDDPRKTTEVVTTVKDKTYKSFADILNKKDPALSQQKQDTFGFALDKGAGTEALTAFKTAKILKADSVDANNIPVFDNRIKAAGIVTDGISGNPNVAGSTSLQMTKGMGIETIIKTVISTSTFMTDQVTVSTGGNPNYPNDNLQYTLIESEEKPLWLYKITPVVKILEWDDARNQYSKHTTYVISLFQSQGRAEKATPMYGLKDIVKSYDYLYTGQNKDVLEFDMTFDTAGLDLNMIAGYRQGLEGGVAYEKNAPPGEKIEADSKHINHVDPFSTAYATSRSNQGIWSAGSDGDYRTVMSKNFMSRIYQGGADKLTGQLTIIGDPDFITQQEGFGLSKHSSLYVNHSVNTHRDPIIHIRFMTPPDINTDTGLLETHSGEYSSGTGNTISVFSGYYRVLLINSTIDNNVFKQVLQLIRVEVQEEPEEIEKESTKEEEGKIKVYGRKDPSTKGIKYDAKITTRIMSQRENDGVRSSSVFSKYISSYRTNVRGAPGNLTSGAGTGMQIKEGLTTLTKATFKDGTSYKRYTRPDGTGNETTFHTDGTYTRKDIVMKGPASWAYDKPKKDGPS